MQLLRPGDRGSAVAEVRTILAGLGRLNNTNPLTLDVFDQAADRAVRAFQQTRGLTADGVVGPETYRALSGARWRRGDRVLIHNATALQRGDDVEALQKELLGLGYDVGRADGVFGRLTENAVRNFQRDSGLVPDGVCATLTLRALEQLGRRIVGGRPQLLREMAAVADAGPNLLGKRVVVDPSHGGPDPGAVYGDLTESDLVWDLASRLEGRLNAVGVTTWLTRGPTNTSTDEQRAQFANNQRADLVISLHIDSAPSPLHNGVATYYYGSANTESALGERLADLVQREIVARTSMLDARTHPKTWELLRLTRMPAVWVEVGYLTSPGDRSRIADPVFRDVVAEAILVAVQRLYLPKEEDPPTGVMRITADATS
ncbi:MAG: N-acetylmuramoyl-L-alanine amidase [Pseudonocardiales bacterium]|nr:N-acetylmuramoyl-L-alanine amidase [Pseudonocardiales bacterium]